MSKVLGEIPLTVKLRMGVKDNNLTAHKLMPRFQKEWGVGAVTVSFLFRFYDLSRPATRVAEPTVIQSASRQNAATKVNILTIPGFSSNEAHCRLECRSVQILKNGGLGIHCSLRSDRQGGC